MSQSNVVAFLRACASDRTLLEFFNPKSLPELLFHAKLAGFSFTGEDLTAVVGGIESFLIQQKMGEEINAYSSLWPKMWGKPRLQYVVEDLFRVLSEHELQSLIAPMIHQLIFARPRPGMSEDDFQRYWVETHAVRYTSKIPQIRRYLIDTRIPLPGDAGEPLFSGIAEIWLQNEQEQLASLQTKEFLEGARADEPRWAAFWATLVLDTNTHVLLEGPPLTSQPGWVKHIVLMKRREGLPLETFRRYSLEVHGRHALQLPGLRRYLQCHVRDSFYVVGESRFDAVAMLSFDDDRALAAALDSPVSKQLQAEYPLFLETKYLFPMAMKEHWIIGPEAR